MQTTIDDKKKDQVTLKVSLDEADLTKIKTAVLKRLSDRVSPKGFRAGKAPLSVVEKELSDEHLNSEVLEEAVNTFYVQAITEKKVRVLDKPKISVKSFVPYTDLKFEAEVTIVPDIKLADYKKFSMSSKPEKVTDKDIDEVLENLRTRTAEKVEVDRVSKDGDEVVIDFAGEDMQGKAVAGAKGSDYPLALGSKTFIEGFEEEVEGLKTGDKKDFTLTFPKDYGHKPLANKKVKFSITVKSVKEVKKPEIDDGWAGKVGPFKKLSDLKADVKAQLEGQKAKESQDKLKDEIMGKLVEKSDIPAPQTLIDEQKEALLTDFKQNLVYRGITLQEYLDQNSMKNEEFEKKELIPQAQNRVKVGLALSEVALKEGVTVTDEELQMQLELMKGQYKEPSAQAELAKPEVQQDMRSRMITEKTLQKLIEYAK